MKIWFSIPALALIAVNLAAHALGGLGPASGPDFSPLARMGGQHYAQASALLLLVLMAHSLREHFRPALAAALALLVAALLAGLQPGGPAASALELTAMPLLWAVTALVAASAAAAAVPPPEERPGLGDFKRAVLAVNLANCGLLALLHHVGPGPGPHPGCLATALLILFSVGLLFAAGRWANLAFIAGLAAAVPALCAALVLSARPPWPLEIFALAYGACAGFQLAMLSALSALVTVIALAVRAGVRLTGRVRRPMRPLARTLALFPATALCAAALLGPVWAPRPESAPAPFTGETRELRLADMTMQLPAAWGLGPVRYRLPLAGRADRLILAERRWTSEAELESETLGFQERLAEAVGLDAELSGDRRRLFLRPAWLIATSTREADGSAFQGLELELYLLYPGGGLKLGAAFDYAARKTRAQDYESFARQCAELFTAAAVDIVGRYRWLATGGQGQDFHTVFGAFERPVPGLLMLAAASDRSEAAGGQPVFSSREDWNERPSRVALGKHSPPRKTGASSASSASLTLRWGGPAQTAVERFSAERPGRLSAFPALDRGLAYYQGYQRFPSRALTVAGRPGRLESRAFHRPPLRPVDDAWAGLSLSWTADGPGGPPLRLSFTADLRGQSPEARAQQAAEALGQWQVVADSIRTSNP